MRQDVSGTFVISLDFELYWGLRHAHQLHDCKERLLGARTAVAGMLDLFTRFDVAATWATVGYLFFDDKEELLTHLPENQPDYLRDGLEPYDFSKLGKNEAEDPFHFGLSLVRRIAETPKQEMASHTFSHYFALEPGGTEDSFADDLAAARRAAERLGIKMHSLVFPWNQFNRDYAPICAREGFGVVRGNPESWLYTASERDDDTVARRAGRLADAYLPISGDPATERRELECGVIDIPASRFLRSVSRRLNALETRRLARITNSMTRAAETGTIYHLWWHPHNFGLNTAANLLFLERILEHYRRLRDAHGMRSLTMAEAAEGSAPAEASLSANA